MSFRKKTSSPRRSQKGIALMEALIALVVSALGILGVLGMQMRTLSDTQTSVRREQAIRLIEDFSERMKVNPNAMANMSSFTSDWTSSLPTPAASKDCSSATCNAAELAAYDLAEWKRFVQRALPLGDANVFIAKGETDATDRRQLGVMVRWRENEKSQDSGYLTSINAAADGGTVSCGTGYTCHLQYIPVSARCAPFKGGATFRYFCPGS